jgi:hypothetical protein
MMSRSYEVLAGEKSGPGGFEPPTYSCHLFGKKVAQKRAVAFYQTIEGCRSIQDAPALLTRSRQKRGAFFINPFLARFFLKSATELRAHAMIRYRLEFKKHLKIS